MISPEKSLKNILRQQVIYAEELCRRREWAKAWRTLLKTSRMALDLAQRTDGSEKKRYIDYCDKMREQAETIRRDGKLKRLDRVEDLDYRTDKRRDDKAASVHHPSRGNKRGSAKSNQLNHAVKELKKLKNRAPASEKVANDAIDSELGRIDPSELEAVSFDDIAGLEDVKREIIARVILPYCDPDGAREFNVAAGGGMLLYGPPGTGKTMIAKAVANEIDAPFFSITPAHVIDKFVGESERKIAKLFRCLHSYERAILFIDEADGLLASRKTHSTVMKRVVPQFLMELDGLMKKKNSLMVIAATNVPWELDEAAYRRLPAMIYVPLPDRDARLGLLKHLISNIQRLGEIDYEWLADQTDGFSGSDLKELVNRTCYDCYCQSMDEEPEKNVTTKDFGNQLKTFTLSVRRKDLERFARFRDEFQR